MKTSALRLFAASVLLGATGLLPHADEAHPTASSTRVLSFTHLWADAKGVSHFRDGKLSFEAATPENPTAGTTSRTNPDPEALVALPLRGATGATFLYLKRAAVEDWHRAPRPVPAAT